MDIRLIKTDDDYEAVIKEIERLIETEVEPNTPDGDLLDVLSMLVEAFEEENYPIPLPDPIEAIEYYMESRGLSRSDLEPFIGSRARVSEILNRKRALSLNMIRKLSAGLGIPAEILLQPYSLEEGQIYSYYDFSASFKEFKIKYTKRPIDKLSIQHFYIFKSISGTSFADVTLLSTMIPFPKSGIVTSAPETQFDEVVL